MQLIYTQENRFLVLNMQNVLMNAGIEVILKNEFAFGGVGDLAPIDAWVELWVVNDSDYNKAKALSSAILNQQFTENWTCGQCKEVNAESFESCWQCETERADIPL